MADPSGDPPVIGAVARQQGREDLEGEQTIADREQTLADTDQTSSDRDQSAADSDQAAADSDQAASDRDLAHGGDPGAHEQMREVRNVNAQRRDETGRQRVSTAAARIAVADARDRAAAARDRAASLRDAELAARDADLGATDGRAAEGTDVLERTAEARRQAAAYRAAAAEARARAAADRVQAARDRERAARERAQANEDIEALKQQLLLAETDALTGARVRGAGLADLEREIDRTRRTTGQLVVAYVDVVGLKAVNDFSGHAAGDRLLQRTVRVIRDQLRSYDLIVRVGGDEFVCTLSGTSLEEARQRFAAISASLAQDPEPSEIRVGFADLSPDDDAAGLIERADGDMPTGRRR